MTNELHAETLGRWARRCGISYRTAWRWFHHGKLPKGVSAEQTPTGTILVRDARLAPAPAQGTQEAVVYARINPRQPHSALDQQIESCGGFGKNGGGVIKKVVGDLAPGVGTQRIKLPRLIEERTPRLVV